MSKSSYYYDYTRNMSEEQIKKLGPCGKPTCYCCEGAEVCPHEECKCSDTGVEYTVFKCEVDGCDKDSSENCDDC
jgi:hypothetical protein